MVNEHQESAILVVDDNISNAKLLFRFLSDQGYKVRIAQDGPQALEQVTFAPPDMILLDVMMPEMDGFEVCYQLKKNPATNEIPVIFMTALNDVEDKVRGFTLGAVDYITKPIQQKEVLARIDTHLMLRHLQVKSQRQNEILEQRVRERTQELESTRLEVVRSLGRAAEYRDNETGNHVIRVSKIAHLLAKRSGLAECEAELLFNACPMHDIGKIGIPDSVLLKKDRLTTEEWSLMKSHTLIGEQILSGNNDSKLLRLAASIARSHHERWDGTGYPDGLQGEQIPLSSRITSIADVFDALLSHRPYKTPWPEPKAINFIIEHSKTAFDPELVAIFQSNLEETLAIIHAYPEE